MTRKTLICYTTTFAEPFISIRKLGIEKTWANILKNSECIDLMPTICDGNISSYFFISEILFNIIKDSKYESYLQYIFRYFTPKIDKNKLPFSLGENLIMVHSSEGTFFLGLKLICSIKVAYDKNYDFLVCTNSSSYINVIQLENFVQTHPIKVPFYGGRQITNNSKYGASGSFIVLNKAAIEMIIQNLKLWNILKTDDVALLSLCRKIKLPFTKLDSLDCKSEEIINGLKKEDLKYIHFKVGPAYDKKSKEIREDHRIMNLLHMKISSLSNTA